jgi:hypothetical protein
MLTPELCLLLGIEYDTCMNILKDAGIKSLGTVYHLKRSKIKLCRVINKFVCFI